MDQETLRTAHLYLPSRISRKSSKIGANLLARARRLVDKDLSRTLMRSSRRRTGGRSAIAVGS